MQTRLNLKYRPDIDGLRAIAILAVIVFHVFPLWLPGGFVGVDIFFVISGYLITSLILKGLNDGSFSFTDFYVRRIKRIFPALILVLAACYALGWFVLIGIEYARLGQHIVAGAGFFSNLLLASEAGYFDVAAYKKPLLHLWSLGVEEQFYIVWPLFVWLIWTRGINILNTFIFLAVLSFILTIGGVASSDAAFFLPHTRFWELLIGSVLAYLHVFKKQQFVEWLERVIFTVKRRPLRAQRLMMINEFLAVAGVLLIAIALYAIDAKKVFPGWWTLLPTVAAFLIIAAGPTAWINKRVLGSELFVNIGLISYPLYLWHWPVLFFARLFEGEDLSPEALTIALVASFALAWLTYTLVEKPIRFGSRPKVLAAATVATIIIVASIGLHAEKHGGYVSRHKPVNEVMHAMLDIDFSPRETRYMGVSAGIVGDDSEKRKVAFLGDSNMAQYYTRIKHLIETRQATGVQALFLVKMGCPPIPEIKSRKNDCDVFWDSALRVREDETVDTVVLAALWTRYFNEEFYLRSLGENEPLRTTSPSGKKAFLGIHGLVSDLIRRGKKVYLILEIPVGSAFAPKNLLQKGWDRLNWLPAIENPPREAVEAYRGAVAESLRTIAAQTGAVIIDPVDYLCDASTCPIFIEDTKPMHSDKDHLRASFVRERVTYLDRTLGISSLSAAAK